MADTLSEAERTVITERAEQFRHALVESGVTDWELFLTGLEAPARRALLTELAVFDLAHRWRKGETPKVEEYITRFPDLGPDDNIPPELLVEEHRCRLLAGEQAVATDYRDRFPAMFPGIQEALDSVAVSRTSSESPVRKWQPTPEGLVSVSQQYELVRELGRGMFGEVWLARKSPSGIEKAIKILLQAADRDAAQRELKSLELIKNLRHPYILATEDFWITNNRLHVVMELADGTLRGRLKHYQNLGQTAIPVDELFRYIAEAAEGLDFLHAQKITHRDVKPDNILILHGHAKVADFGLARAQEQYVESMSFAGTPAYMAPEIWGGEGGPPSDLYSLAYAYTELRQGRPPLKPRPFTEMMKGSQAGEFEFADFISEAERTVLRRAMAPQPHHRYPNCIAFAADLAAAVGIPFAGSGRSPSPPLSNPPLSAIFGGTEGGDEDHSALDTLLPGATVTEGKKPEPAPTPRQRAWPFAVAALIVAAVVGVGMWAINRNKPAMVTPTPTTPGGDGAAVYPAGTTPEEGAKEVPLSDRKAPEWVVFDKGGQKVRFRLIAPTSGPAVAPFYISESKITNKLYSGGNDDTPVMNLTALQTRAFAASTFGGDIPSEDEWDHAAGYYDQEGHPTPTRSPGRAWIGKDGPGAVHRPDADKNQYDLLDMAGNGREWTRTVFTRAGQRRDFTAGPLDKTDKLILRGRMYTLDRPLSYAMLKQESGAQPQTAPPDVGSHYTGFRVVLKLP